jgi:hypothetical protein
MSNDGYLRSLLSAQDLSPQEVATLRATRDAIQTQLSDLSGSPRFYYAGSYAKGTMIRADYDLDIVTYWPPDCGFSVRNLRCCRHPTSEEVAGIPEDCRVDSPVPRRLSHRYSSRPRSGRKLS